MTLRLAIAVNPQAGGGRAKAVGARLLRLLREHGAHVEILGRAGQHGTFDECVAAVRSGVDQLVVVGGDGVAHVGINATAGTGTPLAVVPAGSGNDLARQFALPFHDADAACATILGGATRAVDCGRVVAGEPGPVGPWFGNVVACGFDARVALRAASWSRGFVGPLRVVKYPLAVARELSTFRASDYRLTVDGKVHELRAMLVAIGNGSTYGGGIRMVPDARMDDGRLTVTVVHETGLPTLLRMFSKTFDGSHVHHPCVEVLHGTRVEISGPDEATVGDGEPFTRPPAAFEAVPGALTLVVPVQQRESVGGLG